MTVFKTFLKIVNKYKGTIIFVSHDRYFAAKIAEREININ